MTALITPANAQAYVNHGRWIAECPFECGSAMKLEPHALMFHCSECQSVIPIDWPDDADDIWEALMERRIPKTRNWFPVGHPLAQRCGAPQGQTAKQLRDEQREHESVRG